jgi:tRNA dimethylallyltransferase
LIVAGPTASGKSALALELAQRLRGTVINADSMQIYRELRILTARPTAAEAAAIPHALYGVRPAASAGSVAWWRDTALAEMAKAHAAGRLPILCGGTGMYFQSLIQGLADIPDPGEPARTEARALLAAEGPEALHARLAQADPDTAARLKPTDAQRIARAWEVFSGTGQGLAAWQRNGNRGRAPWRFKAILLDPPRDALRPAIEARFDAMLAEGALEEVRALLAQSLDPALPAMRAHGVPELARHLGGHVTLAEARAGACLATTQYTKRQATWFRHHKLAPETHMRILLARYATSEQFSERNMADMQNFIFSRVDAAASAP